MPITKAMLVLFRLQILMYLSRRDLDGAVFCEGHDCIERVNAELHFCTQSSDIQTYTKMRLEV